MVKLGVKEIKELKDGTVVLVQTRYTESTRLLHVICKEFTNQKEDVLLDRFGDYWVVKSSTLKDDIDVYMLPNNVG